MGLKKASSKRGAYSGRLTYDPETGFHTDAQGRKVVTEDEGKTWRYAKRGEVSHLERYHATFATVVGTSEADPHHLRVTPDDAHYDGVCHDPDHIAEFCTGHTEAYK